MADEVLIYETSYANQAKTIMRRPHEVQVLDIATLSAQLDDDTEVIRIQARESAFWWKIGGSTVSAAAETDGNGFLPAGNYIDIEVGLSSGLYIDTAADA